MQKIIPFDNFSSLQYIFGAQDANLKFIEKQFGVSIALNPKGIVIKGEKEGIKSALEMINRMMNLAKEGFSFDKEELSRYLNSKPLDKKGSLSDNNTEEENKKGIKVPSARKRLVFPKTPGQTSYIRAMNEYDIVFSIGPAGTGKTYLAMAMAVNFLMEKKVRRIILTRPAI